MNSLLIWNAKLNQMLHNTLDGIGLLLVRVWVAQEFIRAGWGKLAAGPEAPQWFATLHFPIPQAWISANSNWVLAGIGEVVLGGLLLLGLGSRLAALGLLYVTWVAVYTVHFDLGWSGWNQIDTDAGQGFKVPLMIAAMLMVVCAQGGGRYALDVCLPRNERPT